METVSPEDFKADGSAKFFDTLHSYALTKMMTDFHPDVSYPRLKDVASIDQVKQTIQTGFAQGKLVLVQGGERKTIYALLKSKRTLYTLEIPGTFPEIDQGYISGALSNFSIASSPEQSGVGGEIVVKGKPQGKRREVVAMRIVPGSRIFGAISVKFPPKDNINLLVNKKRRQVQ